MGTGRAGGTGGAITTRTLQALVPALRARLNTIENSAETARNTGRASAYRRAIEVAGRNRLVPSFIRAQTDRAFRDSGIQRSEFRIERTPRGIRYIPPRISPVISNSVGRLEALRDIDNMRLLARNSITTGMIPGQRGFTVGNRESAARPLRGE